MKQHLPGDHLSRHTDHITHLGVSRSLSQVTRSAAEFLTCSHRFRLITPGNAPAIRRNSTPLKPLRGTHHSSDIPHLVIHLGTRLHSSALTKTPSCERPVVRKLINCNNQQSSTSTSSRSTCIIHSTSSQTSSPRCSGSPACWGIKMFSCQSMKTGRQTRPRPCCGFLTR